MMDYRLFGNTGLRVSRAFLGAMTFGEQGGVGAPLEECRQMLDVYADAGGNVIDTAINYRGGASEEIVGELLVGRRDRCLRIDHIDIYWVHIWDALTPIQETMRALDDAVRAGKVLYIGISDTPAWVVARANTLAEWRGWTSFAGLQVPYSLLQRDIERELLPLAEATGMTVAAWSPLGGGVLSGKFIGPGETPGTRIAAESITEHDRAVARVVQDTAGELGVTPARLAIAWTIARHELVCPILGARRVEQLLDNLGALDLEVPAEVIERLDTATEFEVGFPTDFMNQTKSWVFGQASSARPIAHRL